MFKSFRSRLESLQGTHKALRDIADILHEVSGRVAERRELVDRIEELELSRAKWEAELEGLLLKADSTLKAANNAEARTRTMKKSYEKHFDPLDPDRQAEIEQEVRNHFPSADATPSGAQALPALHVDVEENGKAAAMRLKFS